MPAAAAAAAAALSHCSTLRLAIVLQPCPAPGSLIICMSSNPRLTRLTQLRDVAFWRSSPRHQQAPKHSPCGAEFPKHPCALGEPHCSPQAPCRPSQSPQTWCRPQHRWQHVSTSSRRPSGVSLLPAARRHHRAAAQLPFLDDNICSALSLQLHPHPAGLGTRLIVLLSLYALVGVIATCVLAYAAGGCEAQLWESTCLGFLAAALLGTIAAGWWRWQLPAHRRALAAVLLATQQAACTGLAVDHQMWQLGCSSLPGGVIAVFVAAPILSGKWQGWLSCDATASAAG